MQLLGRWVCEYQRNCWSRQTVSQTAQHCESSITIKITAGKPRRWWQHISCETHYISLLSVYFPYLWYQNETLKELKPYNCSKKKTTEGYIWMQVKKKKKKQISRFSAVYLACRIHSTYMHACHPIYPFNKTFLISGEMLTRAEEL